MVFDSMAQAGEYFSLGKFLKKAFDFVNTADLEALAEGRYEIDGDNVFMMINERDLKKPADAALEVHNKYIDIQIVIKGTESFGWKVRSQCKSPRGQFNKEKDILFFDDKPSTYVTLKAGEFAIFFPEDAHAPLVGEGHVKKCIIKVAVK